MQNRRSPGGRDPRSDPPTLEALAVRRPLLRREQTYTEQVERLIAAGLEVMRRNGTTRRPTVAEIVEESHLSNVSFYRHFASKDDLVAAVVEAGRTRLVGYLAHLMEGEDRPERQIRRWAEGFLSQAKGPTAISTRAVLWNGGYLSDRSRDRVGPGGGALAELLIAPLESLGNPNPPGNAGLMYHAVIGQTLEYLWRGTAATPAESEHVVRFCLTVATGSARGVADGTGAGGGTATSDRTEAG